jgi:hypothetical protein
VSQIVKMQIKIRRDAGSLERGMPDPVEVAPTRDAPKVDRRTGGRLTRAGRTASGGENRRCHLTKLGYWQGDTSQKLYRVAGNMSTR